jgi:hypothetical protein
MTAAETDAPRAVRKTSWWPAVAVIALIAVVIRIPLFFAGRSIVFDDGQYGVSVVDMRHGLAPYTGVFSSQGPLHYPLLYVGDLLGFRTLDAPRVTPVLAGVAAAIGVWAIARRLGASPAVSFVTGVLLATTGTMLWTTGQVTSDGIAIAFMIWAVWAAAWYRDRPLPWIAVLVGVFVGAAFATKPLVFPALVPVVWWMWERRKPAHLVLAGVVAVAFWFATALPWGLGRVWEQSIAYHSGKGPEYSKLFQLGKLTTLVPERDMIILVAVVLGVVAVVVGACRSAVRHADVIVIVAWLVLAAFVLVFEKALFANHLVNVVVPLVLVFAVRPPPLKWLAIALAFAIPWTVINTHDILWPGSYTGIEAALVRDLKALPSDARAMSDDPAYVWRAGLSTPAMFNDVSRMRMDQHDITTEKAAAAAAEPKTCAVVIWSFRFGSLLPGFKDALTQNGYHQAKAYAPFRELWLKDSPFCTSKSR